MAEFSDTETFDIETILTLPESITYFVEVKWGAYFR